MSGQAHNLDSVVTSFLDHGYHAECACGWKSEVCESLPEALFEYRKHQEPVSPSEEGRS